METKTYKSGDRVSVSLVYGDLFLGTYIKPDSQKKGNHYLQLDGVMCAQSIPERKFTACAGDCVVYTKRELKTGMYVMTKRGEVFQVLLGTRDGDILVNKAKTLFLSKYTLFLESITEPKNTIQTIYQPDGLTDYLDYRQNMITVWNREPEREPMTLSQIEEKLGMRIRLIEE